MTVISGVLQGSVIEPLLFIHYSVDMLLILKNHWLLGGVDGSALI